MKKIIFLFAPSFIFLSLFSLSKTYTLFSDSAISANNTFTAATEFPTENIADHVVISEVQIALPAGGTDNDFIELYNPTNQPYDLNGHRLVKRTISGIADVQIKSWSVSTTVPAHSYYLWANSTNGYATSIGADASTSATLAVNNSIAIRLGDLDTGTIIDALSWSTNVNALSEGTKFSSSPGAGNSMERKAVSSSTNATMDGGIDELKGNGYDTNNNDNDFILRLSPEPQNSTSPTEQL